MINETEFNSNYALAMNKGKNFFAGHHAQLVGEDIKIELEAKSQSSDKEEPSQTEPKPETPVKQSQSSESNLSTPEPRLVNIKNH